MNTARLLRLNYILVWLADAVSAWLSACGGWKRRADQMPTRYTHSLARVIERAAELLEFPPTAGRLAGAPGELNFSSIVKMLDLSTVITPLPTLSIVAAMTSPISRFCAEIEATQAIFSLGNQLTGLAADTIRTVSTACSIPYLEVEGHGGHGA